MRALFGRRQLTGVHAPQTPQTSSRPTATLVLSPAHRADEILSTFAEQLKLFAQKYRNEIRADPEFRREFQVGTYAADALRDHFSCKHASAA